MKRSESYDINDDMIESVISIKGRDKLANEKNKEFDYSMFNYRQGVTMLQ